MLRKFIFAALASGLVLGALSPSQAMTLRIAPGVAASDVTDVSYHGSRRYSEEHYRWCEYRYKSYDRYTNTYKPYYGPRKQCVSPYY